LKLHNIVCNLCIEIMICFYYIKTKNCIFLPQNSIFSNYKIYLHYGIKDATDKILCYWQPINVKIILNIFFSYKIQHFCNPILLGHKLTGIKYIARYFGLSTYNSVHGKFSVSVTRFAIESPNEESTCNILI